MRLTNVVLPGNSGGPLVADAGPVVGVVFAIERATGHGPAIPISALTRALQRQNFFANPSPC